MVMLQKQGRLVFVVVVDVWAWIAILLHQVASTVRYDLEGKKTTLITHLVLCWFFACSITFGIGSHRPPYSADYRFRTRTT